MRLSPVLLLGLITLAAPAQVEPPERLTRGELPSWGRTLKLPAPSGYVEDSKGALAQYRKGKARLVLADFTSHSLARKWKFDLRDTLSLSFRQGAITEPIETGAVFARGEGESLYAAGVDAAGRIVDQEVH